MLDPACAVFVVIAMGVLITGSMWNTQHERARAARCRAGGRATGASVNEEEPDESDEDRQLMTRGTIVFFLVFASVFLTLLYFFYKYVSSTRSNFHFSYHARARFHFSN